MENIIVKKVKRRNYYVYDEIDFDSREEVYFYWYLLDLKSKGIIKEIIFHPDSMILFDKDDYPDAKEFKLQSHSYTADFKIIWNNDYYDDWDYFDMKINYDDDQLEFYSILEIKPTHDKYNMIRLFKLNQKWIYADSNIFVDLVIPINHFKKTFYPKRYYHTDSVSRKRKGHKEFVNIEDFLFNKRKEGNNERNRKAEA